MRFLTTALTFLLVASFHLAFSASTLTKAQNKCAELVIKWLTDLLETDQVLKILVTLNNGIYDQWPTANITQSVYDEILKSANSKQAIVALGGYGRLKNDLGNNFDSVSNKLFGSLNSVLDEVFNESIAAKLKAERKPKNKVLAAQYKKINSFIYEKVKKAFSKCSKAIERKYWQIVVKDFGPILNFDQFST